MYVCIYEQIKILEDREKTYEECLLL